MPVAGGAGCGMCTRHCACGTALALRGRTEGAQPGNAHNRAADVVDLTTAPDLTDRTDGADGVGDADELNPASRVGEAPGTATRARPAKGAYTVDCDGGLTRDDSSDEGEQLSFVSLNYDDADLRDLRVAFGLGSDVTKHLCSKEKRAASAASGSFRPTSASHGQAAAPMCRSRACRPARTEPAPGPATRAAPPCPYSLRLHRRAGRSRRRASQAARRRTAEHHPRMRCRAYTRVALTFGAVIGHHAYGFSLVYI